MPNVTNISQTSVKYGGLLDKMFLAVRVKVFIRIKGGRMTEQFGKPIMIMSKSLLLLMIVHSEFIIKF